jgi:ABC-type transport system involved in multi-copper enzyme maturation permease subunit
MNHFFKITNYEFKMSIRRPGFWITYALLIIFYVVSILAPSMDGSDDVIARNKIWQTAGNMVFTFNVFMPLLAGILSADRMQRDFHNGVRELQSSSPLSIPVYIMAKYLGILLSVVLPMAILVAVSGIALVIKGLAPLEFLWPLFLAFISIVVPAHAFVVAFSLACPLIMPLRVYQVLFTGYWFWGNLLSPKAFPTISDSLLNAVGQYPLQAYFNVTFSSTYAVAQAFTPIEAVLNLIVLMTCITIALFAVNRYLHWQEQHA